MYTGMFGFGDALLFVGVFGVASLPPTGALLYFLRPFGKFWSALRIAAAVIAITGIAALIDYVAAQNAGPGSAFHDWSALAVLRIFAAPLCALGFFVCGVFAPNWPSRIPLLATAAIETVVFGCVALIWFHPFHSF